MSIIRNLIYSISRSVRTHRAEQPQRRRWEIAYPQKNEHAEKAKESHEKCENVDVFTVQLSLEKWKCFLGAVWWWQPKPVSKVECVWLMTEKWNIFCVLFSTKCKMLCVFAGWDPEPDYHRMTNAESEIRGALVSPRICLYLAWGMWKPFFPSVIFSPFSLSIKIWAKIRGMKKKLPWFHAVCKWCSLQLKELRYVDSIHISFGLKWELWRLCLFHRTILFFHTNIHSESVVIIIRLRQATSCDQLLCCAGKIYIFFDTLIAFVGRAQQQ